MQRFKQPLYVFKLFKLYFDKSYSLFSEENTLRRLHSLSLNWTDLSVPDVIQFDRLCLYLLHFTHFSGKCLSKLSKFIFRTSHDHYSDRTQDQNVEVMKCQYRKVRLESCSSLCH